MKILFWGTPEFAVPTLKTLYEANHEIVGVVTQPDRPKGRGRTLQPSPVKQYALEKGLQVFQPEKASNPKFIDDLYQLRSDMFIVIAYGQILRQTVLEIPKWFCMNIHASLLPKYRGAAPINRSILNGDTETGITTMKMDEGMDTGDMLLKRTVPIKLDDDAVSLAEKLSKVGAESTIETLELLARGKLDLIAQNDSEATLAPKLKKEEGLIDWEKSAETLHNQVRGFSPWPGAYTFYGAKRVSIIKSEMVSGEESDEPGVVARVSDYGIEVGTSKGRLIVKELKPEGKGGMSAQSFLRGNPISKGERFLDVAAESAPN
jgi:methionyl-tRNA formyltransferase